MSYTPLTQLTGGTLSTTSVNLIMQYVNTLFAGLGNSRTLSCNADLTLTTSAQDISGCTTTFAVAGSSAFALVVGSFDADVTSSSAGVLFQGKCVVDGNTQTSVALFKDNGVNTRGTPGQHWIVPLTIGPHTIKLQGLKSGSAAGTHVFHQIHTQMSVLVVDVP